MTLDEQWTSRLNTWNSLIATAGTIEAKLNVFSEAAYDLAGCVGNGMVKPDVIDALRHIAIAHNLGNEEDIGIYIGDAFIRREWEPKEFLKEAPNEAGNGQDRPKRFKLIPFAAITFSTAINYLVKGILPRVGLAVVWGPPKCGKSFWTFDIFMHIALGWLYRGRKVQQGPVVYLALEGGHGFKKRVEAWRRRHLANYQGDVPFYLIDVPIDLIADHGALILSIRAQIGEQVPVAVAIDTLNRALNGDENKPADMAKFVRAADAIRVAFECLVAIVHHCGIQGGRPRGHSSLPGADDVQIGVEHDDNTGIITAKVDHAKDMEAGATIAFRLELVELGLNQEDDPITSCVVVPVEGEAAAKPKTKLPPIPTAALRSLHECLADVGVPAPPDGHIPERVTTVTFSQWREYLFKHAIINREGNYREQFRRIHVTLKNAGKIGIWNELAWSVTSVTSRHIGVTCDGPKGGRKRHVTSHHPLRV